MSLCLNSSQGKRKKKKLFFVPGNKFLKHFLFLVCTYTIIVETKNYINNVNELHVYVYSNNSSILTVAFDPPE